MRKAQIYYLIAIVLLILVCGYQYNVLRQLQKTIDNPELDPNIVAQRFHQLSYDSPSTWQRNRWMGIKAFQNPNDAWIIQEIISEVKPDFIIETGTLWGGSALIWASILEHINPEGRVITVDIEDSTAEARKHPLFQRKVDFMLGSSTSPTVLEDIGRKVKGRKVLVILDSDHSKTHVLKELQSYAPFVQAGSYIIVQDSNVNGHPVYPNYGPGPYEAIEEYLETNSNFEPDRDRERLLYTMHPNGFLKRIR